MIEQQIIARLQRTFELYGFAPLETRAVEPLDQLLRKGETSKEVYVLSRLQADPDDAVGRVARAALRPDRTVCAVRSGERRQAAVPVPALPDPEGLAGRAAAAGPLPRVHPGGHRHRRPGHARLRQRGRDPAGDRRRARAALPIPPVTIQVNNRKLCEGFYRGLGIADPEAALRAIDKLDKIGPAGVAELLIDDGRRDRRAGEGLPRAGRDLGAGRVVRRRGARARRHATRCSTRAWTSWSGSSRRRASTRRGCWSRSSRSRAGSTTTPARSTRR